MINPPENRPLQFYLSQRSQPLDPDEDSFFLNNSNEKHECKRPDNLLPAFPSNLEQFVKDSMQSSLKNSSSNMGSGRILLPNPYPKKNSQRNSLFSEEIYENQKFQEKLVQPYKNPTKSRNNSFSIEEFKQYNKKFQGKQLSERLDIISKEFESKVMGDLKKLEDKISESKSSNIVILKANLCSPKPNKVDLSLNDKNNIFYEKTQINNTNETLNERYVSIEKKEEKAFVSLNKKTFSSNSKFDHTNELEYSPFSNKPSNENSRSDLLATQSQKKELIKIEEFTNIKPKEFNIQKVNEKIKKDQELFQKRNSLHKKKDFLIQTNISPSNQELMTQFRNLSVSPINNSSLIRETSYKNTKSNYTEKKSNYSEKKSNYSERKSNYSKNCKNNSSDKKSSYSEKKSNYSEKKDRFDDTKIEISKNKGNYRDEICQANFESFDQYFVTKNDMRKELNIDEDENFRSLGDPLFEPTKFLNFEENKEENLFDKKLRSNSIKENEERKEKNENLKIFHNKVLEIENKALCLIRSVEIQQAIDLLLANEHIIERIFKDHHPQRLYICYLISFCFFKIQRSDACEHYSQKAFKLLKNNECFKYEINCLYAYYILKISATVALENKDFENSINSFQKMLNLYELRKGIFKSNEKTNNDVFYSKEFLNIYYNLSFAYLELNQKNDALFYLKEVERILMEKNDIRLSLIKMKIADLLMDLKNYSEALSAYLELLQIMNKNQISSNESGKILFHIYENIGLLHYQTKSFNDSFYYLEKCIELNDKLFGYTNKKKANLFILLGKISSNIKQFPQAYIYYQKANSLFERLEGINNMTSIDCLLKMAQIKHELKEYILAFELYEKVLQMYIAKIGNNHFFVYVVYLNLIYLSHLLKYEDKKEFYYSELIYHCCNKENNDDFIIFNELGNLFRNLLLFNDAIQNYTNAINCSEKINNKDHTFQVSLVHYNLAVCFQQINNLKESIANNRICLEMNSNIENPKNIAFQIKILYNLGHLYGRISRMNEANCYINQAQELERKL